MIFVYYIRKYFFFEINISILAYVSFINTIFYKICTEML